MDSASSQLTSWFCDEGQIRMTADGQPSVFDIIRVLGGQKNPRDAWTRLTEAYPEVVGKCDNLKFPGRGQRETPVAKTKEDVLYILGFLPGAVGRKYREQAARLFVAYLDNPAELASELTERLTPEQGEWLEARLNGKRTRFTLSDTLKDHGVQAEGYGRCTNAIYRPILGADAKTLKAQIADEKHLPVKRVNPRDHMSIKQLNDLEFAERVAAGQLKAHNARGNNQAERVCRTSAEHTRQLLSGEFLIPLDREPNHAHPTPLRQYPTHH
jgi:hypothetical protein